MSASGSCPTKFATWPRSYLARQATGIGGFYEQVLDLP
jgi:hypothetical protein